MPAKFPECMEGPQAEKANDDHSNDDKAYDQSALS